jgi:Fe-S oxidoreductase/nitrate reductase gamma subunit
MTIERELFWNIGKTGNLTYLIMGIAVLIFVYALYERVKAWRKGKPESRCDRIGERIKGVFLNILLQWRVIRESLPGVMHGLIFWGFLILLVGTALEAFDHYSGLHFLKGTPYLVFSFVMDLSGLGALIGVFLALVRRYILRPRALDNKAEDLLILLLLLGVLITGFLVEGARLSAQASQAPWERWSFVGWGLKGWFSAEGALRAHKFWWWIHLITAFLFVAVLINTKLFHIVTSILSTYFRNLKPQALKPIENIEEAESFGVNKIEEFTWIDLLQLDACIRCGRCQENCPAFLTEKPLNPKEVIQNLKRAFLNKSRLFWENLRSWGSEEKPKEEEEELLIGTYVEENAIWSCTTCGACVEHCPVFIEQFPKLIEMRRYLTLMESRFPQELQTAFKNMENNSNPWGIGMHMRGDWAKEIGLKTLAEDPDVEYLFFVGCAGSFDDRNKKVAIAISKLLTFVGIKHGILGVEEGCCGDSARRLGNEYLYQIMVQQNIETMKNYNVKKIITMCPHCYNTLKNEYPQFGGNFEVYHYVEVFSKLINEDKIKPVKSLDTEVTYHDSCYLGRYNGLYEEPRSIIRSLNPKAIKEMPRSRAYSLCCGGGGGRFWMEEHLGRRINHERFSDVQKTGAQTVITSCPFCLTMLSDAVKEKGFEDQYVVKDLAELLKEALSV